MPKIIENLPERLMDEARRQVEESSYADMTIRSVAKACGVGVGTVYNYYPSKESLVAAFMLEDWKQCVTAIEDCARDARGREPVLWSIYENLTAFMEKHQRIFRDETASAGIGGSFSHYHAVLRSQLAAPLRRFCRDDFTAEFIAEAILSWTVNGKSFDALNDVIKRIF